jgi:hypothetical protein
MILQFLDPVQVKLEIMRSVQACCASFKGTDTFFIKYVECFDSRVCIFVSRFFEVGFELFHGNKTAFQIVAFPITKYKFFESCYSKFCFTHLRDFLCNQLFCYSLNKYLVTLMYPTL